MPFVTISGINTGLRGHDFNSWPGDPPQWEFVREATKPGIVVLDMPTENGDPTSALPGATSYRDVGGAAVPHGPAIRIAEPPPRSVILNPPETRP